MAYQTGEKEKKQWMLREITRTPINTYVVSFEKWNEMENNNNGTTHNNIFIFNCVNVTTYINSNTYINGS
jgi:hypothetical protein